jgi:hypothetical protein
MRDDLVARVVHRPPDVPSTIRSFSVSGCRKLTNVALSHIANCDRITELNLSGVCHVTNLDQLLVLTQLRSLNISNCDELKEDSIITVLTVLTRLVELDISGCYQMTSESLSRLINLPQLRSVSYTRSYKLGNKMLFTLGRIKQIHRLSLGWCSRVSDIALKRISMLPNLQELTLLECPEITYVGYS